MFKTNSAYTRFEYNSNEQKCGFRIFITWKWGGYAAISLQNGDDIKTVSENMGYATVAFTLDVCGHVTEKMRKDSADRMAWLSR